ncbi:hypothetical protein Sjap_019847 [Stephania japonica]|uniref:Uncharacterized protein n=1 Tax=Stephania japonica TaxID=461633 RepID=A0AAP0F6X8_9MAGN
MRPIEHFNTPLPPRPHLSPFLPRFADPSNTSIHLYLLDQYLLRLFSSLASRWDRQRSEKELFLSPSRSTTSSHAIDKAKEGMKQREMSGNNKAMKVKFLLLYPQTSRGKAPVLGDLL